MIQIRRQWNNQKRIGDTMHFWFFNKIKVKRRNDRNNATKHDCEREEEEKKMNKKYTTTAILKRNAETTDGISNKMQ